ncbi:MAG: 3'(2'),5'-bisphosphate nucleotidase CysQ [Planctomycetota bacterium]
MHSTESLDRDLTFAIHAARLAGRRALAISGQLGKDGAPRWSGALLGDVADQGCDGYLQGIIEGRHAEDGLLSEETKDTPHRMEKRRAWIVDPLDGTKEYADRREDWAVHVALAVDGQPVLGAVALPAQHRVAWAICAPGHERAGIEGAGALVRGDSPMPERPRVAVSRSHTPPWIAAFIERMHGEARPAGSVGNKVAMLLLGEADLYVHKVGLKEWDTCAPEVLARALGWHVCRLDGTPHVYNQRDPHNHELIVCRPAVKDHVIATVRACLAEAGE